MSQYELYYPKKNLKTAVKLGHKNSHSSPVSNFYVNDLKDVFQKYNIIIDDDTIRWCEVIELNLKDELMLKRCLKYDEDSTGKEILLVMKEGKNLHNETQLLAPCYVGSMGWYKVAILDSQENKILLRTVKNYTSEDFKNSDGTYEDGFNGKEIKSKITGWTIFGSKIPSQMAADVMFWRRLRTIVNNL